MSKSTFKATEIDNLISNLRGEVGEIIQTWTLMRDFYVLSSELQTDDFNEDIKNQELNRINLIKKKFQDEIISRLSELGHKSYGKVNFYFATNKLKALENEFKDFEKFIKDNHLKAKRDEFISHKKLPPTWDEHKAEHRISYLTTLKGIAKALILMKKIDRLHLGENSNQQWNKMRKKRYDFSVPAKAGYLLLPYLRK
ncbi:MAG TPA: hypothetical protein PKH16_14250 [Aequorivita sp.]|nr:hypothetical protein [Aequorivita sp.]